MTKQDANINELDFTSHYSHDKNEMKAKCVELKKKYPDCKFAWVIEPVYKLSRRDHSPGYSVYACKKYHAHQTIERGLDYINNQFPGGLAYHKAEYDKAVQELINSRQKWEVAMEEAYKILEG